MSRSGRPPLAGGAAVITDGKKYSKLSRSGLAAMRAAERANKCDPFKGVIAPFGYSYDGKLAFICLGPTTQHFSKVIRLGGSKFDDPVTKKKGSRAAMRKEEEKRAILPFTAQAINVQQPIVERTTR